MELTQLQYFLAVANSGHLSRTAQALHISQSALSMSIARLEAELGVLLFDRSGRSMKLNAAGQQFAQQIAPALSELNRAKFELTTLSDEDRHTICFSVEVADVAAELVWRYLEEHPDTLFRQSFDTSAIAMDKLQRGQVDFCLSYFPCTLPEIQSVQVLSDRVLVLVNQNHPLAGRDTILPEELREERIITLAEGFGFRRWTDDICYRSGFRPKVCLEVCELQSITRGVAGSMAVGFVGEYTWRSDYLFTGGDEVARSAVHAIPLAVPAIRRTVYLSYPGQRPMSAVSADFFRFVAEMQHEL